MVYHFSWSSLKCEFCDDYTDKKDWLVVPQRPRDLKTVGLVLGESWGVEPIPARDLRLVGNWLFVRQFDETSYHDPETGRYVVETRPDYSLVRWDIFGDLWCEPWDEVPDSCNPFLDAEKAGNLAERLIARRAAVEEFCEMMDASFNEYREEIGR